MKDTKEVPGQNAKYVHLKTVVFPQFHMIERKTGPIGGFLVPITYIT